MCGIFGIISRQNLPIERMVQKGCDALFHRGPDGSGIFTQDSVSVAHRRLAIIDVEQGTQPMLSADRRYVITFNGEIYNHIGLREELMRSGHVFRTRSDTETLLAAYIEWGTDCLQHLRGMFAFAIIDFMRKETFIARDHFGMKPLLYRSEPGFFAFSSELPALADMDHLSSLTISAPAIMQFFQYQYIPSPFTVYSQIRKLRPAHALIVDFNGDVVRQWRYWDFAFTPTPMSRKEAVSRVESAILDSVNAHTLSDVPIGVYLSGGIDSTLVAATLARNLGKTIPAFTIAFHEAEFSEIEYARTAAKHLGLELHHAYVGPDDFAMVPEILSHYGEPYGDSSVLPTWVVARLARQHVKVALSGDAGDELFCGYHSYSSWLEYLAKVNDARIRSYWQRTGKEIVTGEDEDAFIQSLQHSALDWQRHMYGGFFLPSMAAQFFTAPLIPFAGATGHVFGELQKKTSAMAPLDFAQYIDLRTYLPECLMPKVDVTSMCHGLEVRPALLDISVCREAALLPSEHKFTRHEGGKAVLKQLLLRQGFSSDFVYRKKMGFGIPESLWFQEGGPARKLLMDLLHSHKGVISEFLNLEGVARLLREHSPQTDFSRNLWLIMAFCCWVKNSKI